VDTSKWAERNDSRLESALATSYTKKEWGEKKSAPDGRPARVIHSAGCGWKGGGSKGSVRKHMADRKTGPVNYSKKGRCANTT